MKRKYSLAALLVAAMIAGGCQVSSLKDWFNSPDKWDRQSASDHLKSARSLEQRGDYEGAEQEYAAALRKSPGSVDAQRGLTELQRRRQLARNGASRPTTPATAHAVATSAASPRGTEYERWRLETFRTGTASARRTSPIRAVSHESGGPASSAKSDLPEWARTESRGSAAVADQSRDLPVRFPREYQAAVRPQQPAPQARVASRSDQLPLIVPGVRNVNRTSVANVNASLARPEAVVLPAESEPVVARPVAAESVELLSSPDDFPSAQARLIANPEDVEAIQTVIAQLGEADRAQRWLAASLLEELTISGPTDLVKAQLERALQAGPNRVRVQVALLLGSLGSAAESSLPVLQLAASDPNADVRSAAADAIARLSAPAE